MKIGIYTLAEQRDAFIDGLLADELRKYNHEVVIRSYIYGARESVFYEKPDVVIHPMVGGQYKFDFVKQCKEWGIEVIVRRGEAGMGREQFDKLDDNRKELILGHWDYGPYVDLELVWGQEIADIIASQGFMSAEKIKVCGAFAFDPYFVKDLNDYPDRKKTILFATGFSTANCRAEYCETGLPEESSYHGELHGIHCAAKEKWVDAINELVRYHSDEWDFELKVRPGERAVEYEGLLPDCVKIHPDRAVSSEVLKTIDVLVHSGSTLAIEAHLLSIPAINYCNINPDPLLSKVSPMSDLYDELEFLISRAMPGRTNIHQLILDELINHLYGPIDGKACERAAKIIDTHLCRLIKTNIPNSWPKDPKYLTDTVHLVCQNGDIRWSCPCCRNIFWGKKKGVENCPYCDMKIERTPCTFNGMPINTKTVAK